MVAGLLGNEVPIVNKVGTRFDHLLLGDPMECEGENVLHLLLPKMGG